MVPDDRLLAETDSPYLTPVPFRGHRNEPWRVALIVQRLAEVRGETPAVTGALVTENAKRCFGLALAADHV
jgi:TatD DNase family protein